MNRFLVLFTGADCVVRSVIPNSHQGRTFGLTSFLSQPGTVAAFVFVGPLADLVLEPLLCPVSTFALLLGSLTGVGQGCGEVLLISLASAALLLLLPLISARQLGGPATTQENP